MANKTLDRRTVLKGVLATGATVSIPLPLMEIMLNDNGTAYAQTATPVPPLFVLWFFGNGSLPGVWKPANTGTGSNWALSSQLEVLAGVKSYLTVISGLTNKLVVGGAEHPTGSAGATTAAPLNGNAVTAASIDQVVANLISTGAPFKSIEVGVTPATPNGPQDSLATVSHKGPNAKNPPEFDPMAVFTRLFMGTTSTTTTTTTPTTTSQAMNLANVRKSVLDSGTMYPEIALDNWFARNLSSLKTIVRIIFGIFWAIDGALKFAPGFVDAFSSMIKDPASGQPALLTGWFSFWASITSSNPAFYVYSTGLVELAIAFGIIFGFMRKPVYIIS